MLQGGKRLLTEKKYVLTRHVRTEKDDNGGSANLGEFMKLAKNLQHFFPNNAQGMRKVGVDDDGSCFYHTLCAALNIENWHSTNKSDRIKLGHVLRKRVLSALTKRTWLNYWHGKGVRTRGTNVPPMDKMIATLKNNKAWADVYAIMFTMHILHLNLIVFDMKESVIYCGTHDPTKKTDTIFICWIAHSHFEPIVHWDKDKGVRGKFAVDDPIMQHVLNKYMEQGCPRYSLHDILKRKR